MPKKINVVALSIAQRIELETLIRSGTCSAHTHTHARILLKADAGADGPAWTDKMICLALDVGASTVARVRQTFVETGLSAALARQSPQRVYERALDGAAEAHLIALTCGAPPEGAGRWSLRLLADRMVELEYVEAVSHETVRRTLKKTNSNRGG